MDEKLSHAILKLVDDHLIINDHGAIEFNEPSFFLDIHTRYPDIDHQQLILHLNMMELDLPSQLITEMCGTAINSLKTDETLANYQIIKLLAQGGMGEVYLAKRADGQYDKQVALKILSKGLVTDEALLRFQSERQILANLRHPNIVPIIDAGTTQNNRPWFVLEYIDGIRIDDFCQQQALSHDNIIRLFLQVCGAIIHAHQQGVIHRDLKPANILVESNDDDHKVMVLDFGIALHTESQELTGTGQLIGTPGYMSPEQTAAKMKLVDHRSDVFALGVILFRLLTGTHPFKGASATETNFNVMKRDPPHLSNKQVHAKLTAIINKCLHKSLDDRYQSVQALSDDCQRYINKEPVMAEKVTLVKVINAKFKKRPLVSLFSFLALLIMGVLAGLLVNQNMQSKQRNQQLQQYLVSGKELEQKLREQQILPIHDLSATYASINQQINDLKIKLSRSKQQDLGYIYATLGNAYLLLSQPKAAVSAFEQAEEHQFNNLRMQMQWALALAQQWEHESNNLAQINNKQQRDQHRKLINDQYLIPAKNKLEQYLLNSQNNTYLQAYLAFLNHDLHYALKLANQAADENPALFEAHRLAGNTNFLEGREYAVDGKSELALQAYQKAESYYQQAIVIGRSDPESYQSYCQLMTVKMQADMIGNTLVDANYFNKAENICAQAELVLPNQLSTALRRAEIASAKVTWNNEHQQYSFEDSKTFLDYATSALELAPKNTEALAQMIWALIRISSQSNHQLTLEEKNHYLLLAQQYAETSIEINDEDAYNWANLADIHYTLANRNIKNFNITPHVQAGLAAYAKSNEIKPSYAWLYNMANLTKIQADYFRHQDEAHEALKTYQRAINLYQSTVKEAADFSRAWLDLANTYGELIEVKSNLNQSNLENFIEAAETLNRACLLYRAKGGVNSRLTDVISRFQSIESFKMPEHCLLP